MSVRAIGWTWLGVVVACVAAGRATAADPFREGSRAAWMTVAGDPVGPGWEIVDGVFHLRSDAPRYCPIVTREEFGDFALDFEWRIAPRGNSGIKYRVRSYDGKMLGCEYQICDDVSAEGPCPPLQSAAALYDLYEPGPAKTLRPVGDYNTGRIVVRRGRIEHWLNGALVVEAQVGSPDWNRRIAGSKFAERPGFAANVRGRLMLTDHGSEVWLREFRFTPD
jgi:hypothetical protein